MSEPAYHFTPGTVPLLVSIPHLGREIPQAIRQQLTPIAEERSDTDWHLDRVYRFAHALGASVLSARFSRYVIDLNRPPDGESLYPGQTTTGLCPTETFRGAPLYRHGVAPDAAAVRERLNAYWRPYHEKLADELARLRERYGAVLLWEAHSIASVLPRLFDGKLPDLNLGNDSGNSCRPDILAAVTETLAAAPFTWVANGRFRGGYITRHYGDPAQGVHAVQLEMCQSTYMDETAPYAYREDLAARVEPVVERMVRAALRTMSAAS